MSTEMKCKCQLTCVKVWMCLAVCGCLTTLTCAILVLSHYNFETVIGPLPCKLQRIETLNCCYDTDCIYGKKYKYHFSSNSSRCMDTFDIYNHPTNTSVHFSQSTDCYPSLKSLQQSSPDWYLNDSVAFYVNEACTNWIPATTQQQNVQRNLLWIAVILTFVACSCVSMICGFVTMYHKDLVACFTDLCLCCKCYKRLPADEAPQIDDKLGEAEQIAVAAAAADFKPDRQAMDDSSSSSGDGNKYNPNGHRRRPSPVEPPPSIPSPAIDAIANGHLSVEHAIVAQQQLSKQRSHASNVSNRSKKSKLKRARTHSNASKGSSRLSPLSNANDTGSKKNIPQFFADGIVPGISPMHRNENEQEAALPAERPDFVQQISREEIIEARKEQSKQLKRRVYNNLINNMKHPDGEAPSNPTSYNYKHLGMNSNDEDIEAMADDLGSAGMSDSVYFENEWYDESVPKEKCPLNADGQRHSVFEQTVVVNDEPLDEEMEEMKGEANREEKRRRTKAMMMKKKKKMLQKTDSNQSMTLPQTASSSRTATEDMDDDDYDDEESETQYSD